MTTCNTCGELPKRYTSGEIRCACGTVWVHERSMGGAAGCEPVLPNRIAEVNKALATLCDLAKSGKSNDGDRDNIWELTRIVIASAKSTHIVGEPQ